MMRGIRWFKLMEQKEDIEELLKQRGSALNNTELQIITKRYGINGVDPVSFEEIGSELGLSKQRIHVVYRQAIEKLKGIR